MDLTWTAQEDAFRAEVRAWLDTELAAWRRRHGGRIESGDTAEGFAQHLDWERTLFDARYARCRGRSNMAAGRPAAGSG